MLVGIAGGAGVGRLLREGSGLAGGLPGGVVDWLFSFSLKPSIILGGKVCPFSQMSTSFLIFSYAQGKHPVSFYSQQGSDEKCP